MTTKPITEKQKIIRLELAKSGYTVTPLAGFQLVIVKKTAA